ncbi:MAG: DUF6152 family protein [Pseudomonadales bacterium]|nr:DUF6152 family protein [Pseudomonadales bacterium]
MRFRSEKWLLAGFVLLLSSITIPLAAHHASAPFYDPDNRISIEGTITRFVFRNPHAFLFLDVTEDTGENVEWQVELGAPVSLRRTGWTPDTLEVGMTVKVTGNRSRAEGSRGLCCVRMTREDGSPVLRGGRVEEEDQN